MSVVPTGRFQQAYLLKWLVASTSTFKDVVGAVETHEAAAHCHYPAGNVIEEGHSPPWALISDESEHSRDREGLTFNTTTGSILLGFDFYIPADMQTEEERHSWFSSKVGAIIKEMEDLVTSRVDGPVTGETHLNMTNIQRVQGPFEIDTDEFVIEDPEGFPEHKILYHIRFQLQYR